MNNSQPSFDALLPREMAQRAESIGASKADMQAMTMFSLATIWIRTGLMPRWLGFVTFLLGLTLLVVVDYSPWVTLVFPAWVVLISLFILWLRLRHPDVQILSAD